MVSFIRAVDWEPEQNPAPRTQKPRRGRRAILNVMMIAGNAVGNAEKDNWWEKRKACVSIPPIPARCRTLPHAAGRCRTLPDAAARSRCLSGGPSIQQVPVVVATTIARAVAATVQTEKNDNFLAFQDIDSANCSRRRFIT